MQKKALILGNYRPSYVLARALVKRGYTVICGLDGFDRGAEVSKYVSALWDHPSIRSGESDFQQALNNLCAENPEISLICPVAENFVQAFAERKLSVPPNVKLVSMANDTVRLCLDKPKLLAKAQKLGIPVAPFALTSSYDELMDEAEQIGFPLVVRPMYSTSLLSGKKAVTVHSLSDLATRYAEWQPDNSTLVIQRHVSGKRDNIYFAAHQGKVFRLLHAKIERTDQPDGSGLALEGVTVEPCPILNNHVCKLIEELDYSGIGCVQFLVDAESGDHYLLEINPRIAGNHALAEALGLDLSGCIIDQVLDQEKVKSPKFSDTQLRYTWLAGECDSLRRRWRRGELSSVLFVKNLYEAFKIWRQSDLDISINKEDWKPGFFSLCDSLPLIGKLTRKRLKPGIIRHLFIRKEWLRT